MAGRQPTSGLKGSVLVEAPVDPRLVGAASQVECLAEVLHALLAQQGGQRDEHLGGDQRVTQGGVPADDADPQAGGDGLGRVVLLMTSATGTLLEQGVDVLDVTQAVAHANDVLTSRLLLLAAERLGPPPYAYAWLALGSHGRGEQLLSSDQDSALTYGGPRLAPGDPDVYFGQLAERVVDGLALAGIPRCAGGYMATEWRHPLETLTGQFERWVNDPRPPRPSGPPICCSAPRTVHLAARVPTPLSSHPSAAWSCPETDEASIMKSRR